MPPWPKPDTVQRTKRFARASCAPWYRDLPASSPSRTEPSAASPWTGPRSFTWATTTTAATSAWSTPPATTEPPSRKRPSSGGEPAVAAEGHTSRKPRGPPCARDATREGPGLLSHPPGGPGRDHSGPGRQFLAPIWGQHGLCVLLQQCSMQVLPDATAPLPRRQSLACYLPGDRISVPWRRNYRRGEGPPLASPGNKPWHEAGDPACPIPPGSSLMTATPNPPQTPATAIPESP